MLMFMELHVSDASVSIIFSGSKTVSVSLGKLALKEDMTVKQRPSSYFFCMAKRCPSKCQEVYFNTMLIHRFL